MVEQNARLALGLADRGYVLETGNIVLHDKASALMGSEHVRIVRPQGGNANGGEQKI
jgi:branched-chain amino acid transport system ATP-binding protein